MYGTTRGRIIVFADEIIHREAAERIAAQRSKVAIYTALGCDSSSVCARCYGAPADGAVGARAALELALGVMQSQQQRYQFMPPPEHSLESVELKSSVMGWVRYKGVHPVWVKGALRAAVSKRHGMLEVFDRDERLRERYLVLPGDWLFNEDGSIIGKGTPLLARTREREFFAFVHDGGRDRLARPQLDRLSGALREELQYNTGLTRRVMAKAAPLMLKTRDWTGSGLAAPRRASFG